MKKQWKSLRQRVVVVWCGVSVCACVIAWVRACMHVCVCSRQVREQGVCHQIFSSRNIDGCVVSDQSQWFSHRFPLTTFATLQMSYQFKKCLAQSLSYCWSTAILPGLQGNFIYCLSWSLVRFSSYFKPPSKFIGAWHLGQWYHVPLAFKTLQI